MNKYQAIFDKEAKLHDVRIIEYRKSAMSGVAYSKTRRIIVPRPKSKISLSIALHEVGHIAQGRLSPRYYEEYMAEQWAINKMKEYGFKIPRKVSNRAKRYVAYKFRQAMRRGLKWEKIKPEHKKAIKWAGWNRSKYNDFMKYNTSYGS